MHRAHSPLFDADQASRHTPRLTTRYLIPYPHRDGLTRPKPFAPKTKTSTERPLTPSTLAPPASPTRHRHPQLRTSSASHDPHHDRHTACTQGAGTPLPIPVDLNVSTSRRRPERIETAIYYVVTEALTNKAKHAHATIVIDLTTNSPCPPRRPRRRHRRSRPLLPRSALTGINDRILTLDGTMKIISPAGGGTKLLVELPGRNSR